MWKEIGTAQNFRGRKRIRKRIHRDEVGNELSTTRNP